jgi:3-phosphoshikimate 1-carboxyvinyltransferase
MGRLMVEPSRVSGKVRAPPSKSYTHRAFILAALAKGRSKIKNPLISLDTLATIEGIRSLGARVERSDEVWMVEGTGGKISPRKDTLIDAKNSGTTMRLISAVAALSPNPVMITGDESLLKRPMGPLVEALRLLGARAECKGKDGRPPVVVGGGLRAGEVTLPGNVSSQFISALLIAGTQVDGELEIKIDGELVSRPYVEITLELMRLAGADVRCSRDLKRMRVRGGSALRPIEMEIPGDFSSAAFPLVAGAITRSRVRVENLDLGGPQGDKRVVDFLRALGGEVEVGKNYVDINDGDLEGTELDCKDNPDLVPPLAVVGSVAEGKTEIINVPHLRLKESDRLRVLATGLGRMGAKIRELPDGLRIWGVSELKGSTVDSFMDHRMAMAFAVAGLVASGQTIVEGAESIPVSYPTFVEDMRSLGARMRFV